MKEKKILPEKKGLKSKIGGIAVSVIILAVVVVAVIFGVKALIPPEKEKGYEPLERYNVAVDGGKLDTKSAKAVLTNALLTDNYDRFVDCEIITPVYIEIDKKTEEDITTYYLVSSMSGYTFQNGKLCRTHGSPGYTAVVKLKKTGEEYAVVEFLDSLGSVEPEEAKKFIKDNFPKDKNADTLVSDNRQKLKELEKAYIRENFDIDREFEITYPEEEVYDEMPISGGAYTEVLGRVDEFFPDWLGTKERVEDGVRYVYETSFLYDDIETKTENGVLSFVKYRYSDEEEMYRKDFVIVNGDVTHPETSEGTDEVVEIPADTEENTTSDDTKKEETDFEVSTDPADPEYGMTEEEIMKQYDYDDGIEYELVD